MPTIRQLQRQFQHAARLGTGRACLLAQAHPAVDFSAAIIDVALRNYAYHPQQEGASVGRNPETLAAQQLGPDFLALRGDVTQLADLERVFETTAVRFGKLDMTFFFLPVAAQLWAVGRTTMSPTSTPAGWPMA